MVTGISSLLLEGETLYYTASNSVFKIDITDATPTPEQLIAGLVSPTGMAIDGNTLYIAEFNAGRISTIDVTDTSPTRIDFITGLNTPNFLLLHRDFLYYSDNNSNIVERIDITAATPTRELVAGSTINFFPTGLAIDGDIIYMAQGIANRVCTVNIKDSNTEPANFATMVIQPLGIVSNGTIFRFSQSSL